MEKLRIYQKALELVNSVDQLIQNNQSLRNDYSLSDQLKRAAVSVLANIAEGYLRTRRQFKNYLQISSGSSNEVVALLQVISLVYSIDTNRLQTEFKQLGKQIMALAKSIPDSD